MHSLNKLSISLLTSVLALTSVNAIAASPLLQDSSSQATAPDNAAANKHHATTADNQPNVAQDREAARKIRKSVIADKSLSMYAHNVKIIVVRGSVTLKGPVRSEDEKKRIDRKSTRLN